jgi:hypothetical protein
MMRFRLSKVDTTDAYAQLIHDDLATTNGKPPSWRKHWDPRSWSSLHK